MSATQIATLHTSEGDIRVLLYGNHAPKTVRNFVELAEGCEGVAHPGTGAKTTPTGSMTARSSTASSRTS